MIYLAGILLLCLIFFSVGITIQYQNDIRSALSKLNSVNSQVIETKHGKIECAQSGEGSPVLVIHGAMGGCDHGLWLARSFNVTDYHVVAISRFGYLHSPIPAGANLDLQADIFADLLDSLKIQRVVVFAISAGSTTAIRFIARHPERVSALVMIGPDSPGKIQLKMPPRSVVEFFLQHDFLWWFFITFLRKSVIEALGLVPKDYHPTKKDLDLVQGFLKNTLPVSRRVKGLVYESYDLIGEFNQSVTPESPYPLDQIKTPVLVVNALDDPLAIPENVENLTKKIPTARQVRIANGGHFFFGHDEEARNAISTFLGQINQDT